jgi:hypothetical protein
MHMEIPHPRWKELYQIGGVASLLIAALVVFAVAAFFIWPFTPGLASVEDIFSILHTDRLGGLMSLDLPLLVITILGILPTLALYAALNPVNRSSAFAALVLGLIGVAALIPARPLAELVLLSDRFAATPGEPERMRLLAAGETLLALFNGTAWILYALCNGTSALISSLLMLRSRFFSRTAAYSGILSGLGGIGAVVPVAGPIFALFATFGGILWYALAGRALLSIPTVSSSSIPES